MTAATDELRYSQPTVSHHLASHGAETGAVLFRRMGHGLALTATRQRLSKRAEEILALLQRAEAKLFSATTLQSGTVRMAIFPPRSQLSLPGSSPNRMRQNR
ncbi:LysR family transcriptional regulator [Bifidobacterium psychraerophilum]